MIVRTVEWIKDYHDKMIRLNAFTDEVKNKTYVVTESVANELENLRDKTKETYTKIKLNKMIGELRDGKTK